MLAWSVLESAEPLHRVRNLACVCVLSAVSMLLLLLPSLRLQSNRAAWSYLHSPYCLQSGACGAATLGCVPRRFLVQAAQSMPQ